MPIDIPDGSHVFVDANIFIYHFSGPTEFTNRCTQFLQRIEDAKLSGFTSTLVLAETLHRLMIIEAVSTLKLKPKTSIRYLKDHPSNAKKLVQHLTVPQTIKISVSRSFHSKLRPSAIAMTSRKSTVFSPTMPSIWPSCDIIASLASQPTTRISNA